MPNEYIRREVVLNFIWDIQECKYEPDKIFLYCQHLRRIPAADVVEVVRCGDCDRRNKSADLANTVLCKWLHNITMNKTDFCSYGINANESARWETKNYPDEDDGKLFNMEFYVCTNCGKKVFFNFEKTDECPQCHARMDGGENHAE